MKKSSLAIGLIGILAASWIGGTWYSGKLLEEKYPTYLAQANTHNIAALTDQYHLEIKNTKLVRGLFSTELEDQLIITRLSDNKQYIVPFSSVVEHGPLPLSRLTSLQLMPVMAAAHTEMIEHPSIADIFEASNGIAPLISDITVGYDQHVEQDATIAALNYQKNDISINSSTGKINTEINKNGMGLVQFDIDKLDLGSMQEKVSLALHKLKLHSELQPNEWEYISTGNLSINLESLAFKSIDDHRIGFDLHNINLGSHSVLSGDFLDIGLNYQIDSISINQQALGNLIVNWDLNHLKAETLNQIVELYSTADLTQQNIDQKEKDLGLSLLQDQPAFHIQPFSLKNDVGENKLTLDLTISKDVLTMLMSGNVTSLFDQFELKIDLNKPAIEQLIATFAHISFLSPDESTDLKYHLASKLNQGVQQKIFITHDDQHYQSKLWIENGELKLNGEIVPKEVIISLLFPFIF